MLQFTIRTMPGDGIEDTVADLCRISQTLLVVMRTRFNGCELIAYPGDDPKQVLDAYRRRCEVMRGGA